MKLSGNANIWAVHGTVPYSYESGQGENRRTYHSKKNVTLYVAAYDVAGVLASAKTEMPDLTVWSIKHQSRNQNGYGIIVSDEVLA